MSSLQEIYEGACVAMNEAWDAHKRAEAAWNEAGGLIGGKECCAFARTYKLYNEASIAASKARRAWNKEESVNLLKG